MAFEDYKGKTEDELKKTLMDKRKEQFNLRMQAATGQLEKPHVLRAIRREIARIKTAMSQARKAA